MEKIMQLNQYQKEAVLYKDGPCLVTSCPGSGKTKVLVERTINLIKSGIPQKNILCLTFTNKAANEMKDRISKEIGKENVSLFIGTFHSMCAKILRMIGHLDGYSENFSIIDDRDQLDMVLQVARLAEYDIQNGDAIRIINRVNYFRDQMENFSWVEKELKNEVYIDIAQKYLSECKLRNMIDFSGLIYETIRIIESNNAIKDKIQKTFRYILVDETQDTNKSQFYLVNLLGEKYKNIMLIGDIDQSVYGWRGARYQNIQDFINKYSDCKIISLSKNYRSTPEIVAAASKLIKHNTTHMGTLFETDNKSGQPVKCYLCKDQITESNTIANIIKKLIDDGGWLPSDIAILYRINKMSEPVEQALVNCGIPYDVIGSWNFYDRREIKDCMAMLKLLSNPNDSISFNRISSLVDGLGSVTVGRIENAAKNNNITILEACSKVIGKLSSKTAEDACRKIHNIYNHKWDLSNPPACLEKLIKDFNYKEYLLDKFKTTYIEREENIGQISDSSGEFICKDGVSKYLQQVSLITNFDNKKEEERVVLMSMHASKGLEFPIVFIIGAEENIIPSALAMADDPFGAEEEERRLLYVGISRAEKLLFISYCEQRKKFGKNGNVIKIKCKPSRFLYEAGILKK